MFEKSKRILIFSTAYEPLIGGSELAIASIARHLPDIFFDIITPRYQLSLPSHERRGNVGIYRVGWGSIADKFFMPLTGCLKALALMRKHPYALMHAYQASYGAGAAWFTKKCKPSMPLVVTLQEGKDLHRQHFLVKFFRKLILGKADQVTAISVYLAQIARQIRSDVPITVIPNGVDSERFSRRYSPEEKQRIRARLGIKDTSRIAISVSRLVPKNGLEQFLRAIALLNDRRIVPVLAGDGPLRAELEQLAQQLGIGTSVRFLGAITPEEIPDHLAVADVFVRPSLSEGFGSAFIEAMAAGVPVIGSGVGGMRDFLVHETTGLVCNPQDSQSIASQTQRLLEDGELRNRLIKNARDAALNRYDWKIIASKMRAVYDALTQ